ncbi:MAG: DUF2975 domain-containing protein [Acidimicrobiales bacterium]
MPEEPSRAPLIASRLVTLVLVLAGAFALYMVGTTIDGALRGGREVAVHQDAPTDSLASLPHDVVVPQRVPVTVRIREADTKQLALSLGRDATPMILAVAFLCLLRNLLRSVREGDPFTAANVRRLRTMGTLLAFGVPFGSVTTNIFEQALASTTSVAADLGSAAFSLSLGGPLAGLGLFVLAEVFARGVRMRDDIEGTV